MEGIKNNSDLWLRILSLDNNIKVGDDEANLDDDQEPEPAAACHDFWKQAPGDVLLEIFIRIPDCRSAVRSSAVCRSWRSLILGNPQFIPRFKSQHGQHQDRYPPLLPNAIIFVEDEALEESNYIGAKHYQPVFELYSEEWMFLHGKKLPPNYLDFLPSPMVIRASCNNLLLVSPDPHWATGQRLYICNPITKQLVKLPRDPYHFTQPRSFALLCMPPVGATTNCRFKVVQFMPPDEEEAPVQFFVTVFCSESRNWEINHFHYPRLLGMHSSLPLQTNIVTCNGIFYWLEQGPYSKRVIYLDLLKEQCGAIRIPSDHSYHYRYQIGAVCVREGGGSQHELRLIQVHNFNSQPRVCLKVWRLNISDNSSWVSVHSTELERPNSLSKSRLYVVETTYVHPSNGDIVYTVWGKTVFGYNLINGTYTKIDGMPVAQVLRLMHFPMALSYATSDLPIFN